MALDAPGCEVLVLQLAKTDNLANRFSMRQFKYFELVLVGQAVHNEVASAKPCNKQVAFLSGYNHRVQRLMRFKGVTCSLDMLVPEFE